LAVVSGIRARKKMKKKKRKNSLLEVPRRCPFFCRVGRRREE